MNKGNLALGEILGQLLCILHEVCFAAATAGIGQAQLRLGPAMLKSGLGLDLFARRDFQMGTHDPARLAVGRAVHQSPAIQDPYPVARLVPHADLFS